MNEWNKQANLHTNWLSKTKKYTNKWGSDPVYEIHLFIDNCSDCFPSRNSLYANDVHNINLCLWYDKAFFFSNNKLANASQTFLLRLVAICAILQYQIEWSRKVSKNRWKDIWIVRNSLISPCCFCEFLIVWKYSRLLKYIQPSQRKMKNKHDSITRKHWHLANTTFWAQVVSKRMGNKIWKRFQNVDRLQYVLLTLRVCGKVKWKKEKGVTCSFISFRV